MIDIYARRISAAFMGITGVLSLIVNVFFYTRNDLIRITGISIGVMMLVSAYVIGKPRVHPLVLGIAIVLALVVLGMNLFGLVTAGR